ncbi:hypothetical protein SISNIDRAFT_478931 [Sistotremastrum niveocremeum HHB9708]|uniref:Clathrin/coatomer adaptor adaptin-like N-terminal domain-containing protein n=1 Tax=Sistotremastrum niveocremeum HHB9708 TaxID=1314777 RepID=A0A164TGS5_9AGAM|nr:hypothetical protein SISNIDRAFT_478931 [Sistotremastrum niveocremeum HHB9708]
MATSALSSLQSNAARLKTRLQETISESTRDLSFGGASGSSYFDTTTDEKLALTKKQLDGNSDRDKIEGLKRLIAMISKNVPVSSFFPLVVKNVASPSLEIRKLVYIYLLRHAQLEPDLALLSINTFQKDLADPNPLIRAMALRVLSGIGTQVSMVRGVVVLGVKKCAGDPSPYVRKSAALALVKCYESDISAFNSLLPILTTLLSDVSPLSLGTIAVAFRTMCPRRPDLLHQHYRRWCQSLADVDEWGQVALVGVLTNYARSCLRKPEASENDREMDPDLSLLLSSISPLFYSRNPATILAAVRSYHSLTLPSSHSILVEPLLTVLHAGTQATSAVLSYIRILSHENPGLWSSRWKSFVARSTDSPSIKRNKVGILLRLTTPENVTTIIHELSDYLEDTDEELIKAAVHTIGQCALKVPEAMDACVSALLNFLHSDNQVTTAAAIQVLKSLIQIRISSDVAKGQSLEIIADLARRYEKFTHSASRSCILWLAGQYGCEGGDLAVWAPDLLRKSVKAFPNEKTPVKLQTLNLASKLLINACIINSVYQPALLVLSRYALSLARYDRSVDVRDRARMLSALLSGAIPEMKAASHIQERQSWDEEVIDEKDVGGVVLRKEQVRVVLMNGKRPDLNAEDDDTSRFGFGSLSSVLGKEMGGSDVVPEWCDEPTDASLREVPDTAPKAQIRSHFLSPSPSAIRSSNVPSPVVLTPTGGPSPVGSVHDRSAAWRDLDKFYEDSDEEEEEDDDEDEEEEESEDEEDAGAIRPKGAQVHKVEDHEEEEEQEEESGSEDEEEESAEESNADDSSHENGESSTLARRSPDGSVTDNVWDSRHQ